MNIICIDNFANVIEHGFMFRQANQYRSLSKTKIMLQLGLSFITIYRGGGVNGSGGGGDHKSSQHNQQSTGGRAEHRSGLGDQPGQYATLSKQCKTLESSDFY